MRSRRVSTNQAHSTLLPSSARARSESACAARPRVSNQGMQEMLQRGLLQTKLTLSQPGDRLEQEADRVAERVMRMRVPAGPRGGQLDESAVVQRKCTECEKEEVQRKAQPLPEQAASEFSHAISGGRPLPDAERNFFESRFAHDFSQVRVHTDAQAAEAAQSVSALAYTKGSDVVFGAGEYRPDTEGGRKLMAHELAHVVQQRQQAVVSPVLQRLGANPGCTAAERRTIHQAIFDARGWLNKAIAQLGTSPVPAAVLSSLRRNFGPTYGVEVNVPLILGRLRVAYRQLSTNPIGCAGAADPICATLPCGYSGAGSHASTICSNPTLAVGADPVYQAGCVLHESLHAAFSNFTVDEYSGWHGHSGSSPTYPGAGVDPLLNADSYTTLVMDLS